MKQDAVTVSKLADDVSLMDAATVAAKLGVNPGTGLSDVEVSRRLETDGPNELHGKEAVPTWRKILAQFQDPLIYLLLAAVTISLVAWILEGARGVPVDESHEYEPWPRPADRQVPSRQHRTIPGLRNRRPPVTTLGPRSDPQCQNHPDKTARPPP